MSDYGFTHAGRVYTPNGTKGVTPEENTARNEAIQVAELAHWKAAPDRMLGYFVFPWEHKHTFSAEPPSWHPAHIPAASSICRICHKAKDAHGETEPTPGRPYRGTFLPALTGASVTTWLGAHLGTIIDARVYLHNFGGRMVSLTVRGTNGATYHGRASWDNGSCVNLRKGK